MVDKWGINWREEKNTKDKFRTRVRMLRKFDSLSSWNARSTTVRESLIFVGNLRLEGSKVLG